MVLDEPYISVNFLVKFSLLFPLPIFKAELLLHPNIF